MASLGHCRLLGLGMGSDGAKSARHATQLCCHGRVDWQEKSAMVERACRCTMGHDSVVAGSVRRDSRAVLAGQCGHGTLADGIRHVGRTCPRMGAIFLLILGGMGPWVGRVLGGLVGAMARPTSGFLDAFVGQTPRRACTVGLAGHPMDAARVSPKVGGEMLGTCGMHGDNWVCDPTRSTAVIHGDARFAKQGAYLPVARWPHGHGMAYASKGFGACHCRREKPLLASQRSALPSQRAIHEKGPSPVRGMDPFLDFLVAE